MGLCKCQSIYGVQGAVLVTTSGAKELAAIRDCHPIRHRFRQGSQPPAIQGKDVLIKDLLPSIGRRHIRKIANLINLFNPDTIVIGGLLARTEDYLLLPVKGAVKKHSLNIMSKDTHIVLSKIKEKAGVVGACLTARDRNY